MSSWRTATVVIVAAGLVVAGCTSGGAASSVPSAAANAGAVTIGSTTSGSLGTFLTSTGGKTLYIHAGDSANTSTCTGGCLTAWPPVTVPAGQSATAGSGVTGQLATFARSDGSLWVTYNGLPLYYWQGDAKAGDATGQGVNGFTVALAAGGVPASNAVTSPGPSSSAKSRY